MEVHDQLQAELRGALPDLQGIFDVAVAAAVAAALGVIGVVPDPHADVGHPVFRQDLEQILLLPVEVIEADAAPLLGDQRGHVHTHDEVLRQILHLQHAQLLLFRRRRLRGCGLDRGSLLLRLLRREEE